MLNTRRMVYLSSLGLLTSFLFFACQENDSQTNSEFEIPVRNHDLSYTPFNIKVDETNYIICDSTDIRSGRNGLQYAQGSSQLKKDILSNYLPKEEYRSYNGYIIVRFLYNCEGKTGRYRGESLNYDFTRSVAPSDLVENTVKIIKDLDDWITPYSTNPKNEFSKYINLKFKDGEIEHVIL